MSCDIREIVADAEHASRGGQPDDPDVRASSNAHAARRNAAARSPSNEVIATNPQSNLLPGDLRSDLGNIRAPALLLWGRDDNFIPLEWALVALRGIEDAEPRVIAHCGHWVQFEHQELFDRVAHDFLEEL